MSDDLIQIIPRLENESARAHAAKVAYVTMGPERSTAKVGQKLGKTKDIMDRWSARHGWADTARAWDDQRAAEMQLQAAEQYRADLADYRKRYGEMGKALFGSAARMLDKINKSLKDGAIPLGPNAMLTVLNAAKTAADLEALALRVENLLQDERSRE